MIPSQLLIGKAPPFNYEFVDANIQPGVTYYYWLEEIAISGSTVYGPVQVTTPQYGIFLPFLQRQ